MKLHYWVALISMLALFALTTESIPQEIETFPELVFRVAGVPDIAVYYIALAASFFAIIAFVFVSGMVAGVKKKNDD